MVILLKKQEGFLKIKIIITLIVILTLLSCTKKKQENGEIITDDSNLTILPVKITISPSVPHIGDVITMSYSYINPEMDSLIDWWIAGDDTVKSNSKEFMTTGYAVGMEISALVILYTNDGNIHYFSSEKITIQLPREAEVAALRIGPDSVTVQNVIKIERMEIVGNRDNFKFTVQWFVNGVALPGATANEMSLASLKHGDIVMIKVYWGEGEEGVSNEVMIINSTPTISSLPPSLNLSEAGYQYSVIAQDVDNDPLSYNLSVHPEGMTIDPGTGYINWLLPVEGVHQVVIEVTDGLGGKATQKFNLTLTTEDNE